MALSLWWILSSLYAQSTFGVGELQVLPRMNDSDTGSITFREKRANGTNTAAFSAPDSITATYRLRLPASSAAGALTNDGSGNLSWSTAGLQYWTEGDGTPDPVGSLIPVSSLTQHIGSSAAYVAKLWVKDIQAHSTGTLSFTAGAGDTLTITGAQIEALDGVGAQSALLTYSSGTMNARIFNMTGSAYRVAGTSVIDSLRQGRFTNIIDEGSDTYISLNQTNGLSNSSGQIQFLRQGTQLGELDYDAFNGFQFGTSTFTGSFQPVSYKWQLDHRGDFYPTSNLAYDVGRSGNAVRNIIAQVHQSVSGGKFYSTDSFGSERSRVDENGVNVYASGGALTGSISSASGTTTMAIFNATGTGYRIAGTTVIDSAKTIRSGDIFPDGDGTRSIGTAGLVWASIRGYTIQADTQMSVVTGGVTRFIVSGGALQVLNSFGSQVFQVASSTGNVTSNGSVSANSYTASGSPGLTAFCSGGQTIRNPQFVGGILVSGSCGF